MWGGGSGEQRRQRKHMDTIRRDHGQARSKTWAVPIAQHASFPLLHRHGYDDDLREYLVMAGLAVLSVAIAVALITFQPATPDALAVVYWN
jgi:hypothetical protein